MINTTIKVTYNYSDNVTKNLKVRAKREILTAIESSPQIRAEMRRVFHMANRRIQNIENSGCISPAVRELDRQGKGFSKFAMTGHSFKELQAEYSRAVSFLQQPTSTAKGTREFENQARQSLGLTKEEWQGMREDFVTAYNSGADSILGKIPYKELMQEIYTRAERIIASRMENDSKRVQDALQREINNAAENIANSTSSAVKDLLHGFQM